MQRGDDVVKASGKAIPDGFKWWLVASTTVIVGSLVLFVVNVVAGFAFFTEKTAPLWVTVVGVISVVGMALGFGCLILVFLLAALKGRRNKAVAVDGE
jgi:pilus assembly protein TadC